MASRVVSDYIKGGLAPDVIEYNKKLDIEDEFGDLTSLMVRFDRPKETISVISCKDQLMLRDPLTSEETIDREHCITSHLWKPLESARKLLVSRVFRDEVNVYWVYKLLVYSLGE